MVGDTAMVVGWVVGDTQTTGVVSNVAPEVLCGVSLYRISARVSPKTSGPLGSKVHEPVLDPLFTHVTPTSWTANVCRLDIAALLSQFLFEKISARRLLRSC